MWGTDCVTWAVLGTVLALTVISVVLIAGFAVARKRLRGGAAAKIAEMDQFETEATSAPLHMPDSHHPWPDDDERPRRRTGTMMDDGKQVRWGDYRLFYDEGHYVFSRESGHDQPWLPVGAVPKNHHIVVDDEGMPQLQRDAPPHRRD